MSPNYLNPNASHDQWNKALDYLMELSSYEKMVAQSIFEKDFERAMSAADLWLSHISFLLVDKGEKGQNKTGKENKGVNSQKYQRIAKQIGEGMRWAAASKIKSRNTNIAAYKAYNIARQINLELKNYSYEAELYFKAMSNPNTAITTGLRGQ